VSRAKRERKKAARQARLAQLEAARRRRSRLRQGAVAVVVAAVVVGILFALNSGSKTTKVRSSASTTTPASSEPCPKADGSSPRTTHFASPPPNCLTPGASYRATVSTDVGSFTIDLDAKAAPVTVNNFVFLARYHFFDGIVFHRVIPGFVVQGGDPTGTGTGGPGYTVPDEYNSHTRYRLGSVAMANTGQPHSGGSQFFIVIGPQGESLPPRYTLFGQVSSGMDVVQRIGADGSPSGTPKVTHRMLSVTITQS